MLRKFHDTLKTVREIRWYKANGVTGFSNSEESQVQLTEVVPFMAQDMLKTNGGLHNKSDDWARDY